LSQNYTLLIFLPKANIFFAKKPATAAAICEWG
jgi:hypothetical protein